MALSKKGHLKMLDRSPLGAGTVLQLMWLASPALPVGSFSYSESLEAAVGRGRVLLHIQHGNTIALGVVDICALGLQFLIPLTKRYTICFFQEKREGRILPAPFFWPNHFKLLRLDRPR